MNLFFSKKWLVALLLGLVISLSSYLRFYRLTENPPSVSWDEAAVGYNAWSILHWGKDEWGNKLPLVFKSFEDDKHPLHIYLTVPSIALFGLNELGVRASSALFGVLNVLIMFFLGRRLFKSDLAGVISSFVLAISPYNIHFSRFNHELNFVLFFFMLGLYLFLEGIRKKNYLIVWGFASLGLDLLGYHSAKVIVPPIILLLIALYFNELITVKKYFVLGLVAFLFFVSLLFIEPALLGGARFKQTTSEQGRTLTAIKDKYLLHFTNNFLFVKGDSNPRLSSQTGTFYRYEAIFLAIGVLALLLGIFKGRKEYLIILSWALLAPLPSSITTEAPHAARAMFMTGSGHLIIALGIFTIINFVKPKVIKSIVGVFIIAVAIFSFTRFWTYYFEVYKDNYAIDWQYGMKQVVNFVNDHPEYDAVYMTPERQQPYIFYLFYQSYSLPDYLKTVRYNNTISRPANTVAGYSNYHFGLWNEIESLPIPHVLYVVTPSTFSGLRHISLLDVVSEIKYPNGTVAFYLVTAKIYE